MCQENLKLKQTLEKKDEDLKAANEKFTALEKKMQEAAKQRPKSIE